MKIKVLIPIMLLFSLSMFSQKHGEKREKVKALKVSFITTELNLTGSESTKFWPVYNAFEEKQFEIRHDRIRSVVRKLEGAGIDAMSDKEASAYLDQLQDAEEDLLKLRKKLVADLKPVIGPVRVLKLKKAEEDFNRKLLRKYRGNNK